MNYILPLISLFFISSMSGMDLHKSLFDDSSQTGSEFELLSDNEASKDTPANHTNHKPITAKDFIKDMEIKTALNALVAQLNKTQEKLESLETQLTIQNILIGSHAETIAQQESLLKQQNDNIIRHREENKNLNKKLSSLQDTIDYIKLGTAATVGSVTCIALAYKKIKRT